MPTFVTPEIQILTSQWPDYALLDTGRRRKLERFGSQVIIRGEPKAWWEPALPESEWAKAQAVHDEDMPWRLSAGALREWTMRWRDLTLQARITDTSKHLGVFPEQSPHWEFIHAHGPKQSGTGRAPSAESAPKLLNLFGYTGVATLAAASAGFAVTHVDASKPAVAWARNNQALSGLEKAPIRWILDDAVKFVRREVRRGVRYDALALDPPSFGRGPAGEIWKVEIGLPELLALCREALVEKPRFVLLTLYNLEASSIMLGNVVEQMMRATPGKISIGELALTATAPGARRLPLSLWARWEA
jgi:23S rRNA (cytosine1962-C5)-methyltransferase